MHDDVLSLTEREKETLRLLLRGHDAKSIARDLKLSVHTVNQRLRDARRKLGVASSREAARLLAGTEHAPPEKSAGTFFGMVDTHPRAMSTRPARSGRNAAHRLAWFSGGMLAMSLVIAAIALSAMAHGNTAADVQPATPIAAAGDAAIPADQRPAREWLVLMDRGRWQESWLAAAGMFRSQLTPAQWATMIRPVREPLGAVIERTLQSTTRANTLPGAPAGDYTVLQFRTRFTRKDGVIETVTLARDGAVWKVAGYFVR